MQRIAILVAAALLAGCEAPPVTKEEMSSVDYGPRPTRWQEEIRSYLGIRLTDPKSAIIEFRTEPKQMYQRSTDVLRTDVEVDPDLEITGVQKHLDEIGRAHV